MNLRMRFVTFSLVLLFILGCGPKVNLCVIDSPIGKAHCVNLENDQKQDKPLLDMKKWQCVSADDFAEIMRGNGKNVTVCTIVDPGLNDVYCNTVNGPIQTNLDGIHKFTCFTADDWGLFLRYLRDKKK